MESITGMKNALDYIERHITEKLDYGQIARQALLSSYHFQRVFGILCGYTMGEYIRNRRLALAGEELMLHKTKVIDVALKYGYDSPDSFAKAFFKFHGITPSAAREPGAQLHAFPPLSIKISLEGGQIMKYRIEEKKQTVLTGYRRRFDGVPGERSEQEERLFMTTRTEQYLLNGMSGDPAELYTVIDKVDDTGYDFAIAARLSDWTRGHMAEEICIGDEAKRFENIQIPAQTYAVFETERSKYPTQQHLLMRKQIVCQWLPFSGYELADGPEINVYHWYKDDAMKDQRWIEIWLPVTKR